MLKNYYNDFPTISCNEAQQKIGDQTTHFLDTRELNEFNTSHIEGAMCVGYDRFNLKSVLHLPKDELIIVYCSIGARSQNIGEKLVDAGFTNVKNIYGGFFHWNNIGLPKVDNNEKTTDAIHGYSSDWGKWLTNGKIVY